MDAKPLLKIKSPYALEMALRALKALADYHGLRPELNELLQRHNIKVRREGYNILDEENIEEMIDWYRRVYHSSPQKIQNSLRFMLASGLRPTESLVSMRLIAQNAKDYVVEREGFARLEHARYPEIFIRRVKKAYLSFVPIEALDWAKSGETSYDNIRNYVRRKLHMPLRLEYARKIWGTYLKDNGVDSEIINMLQGRVKKNVFLRYYYRPDLDKLGIKIANVTKKLIAELNELGNH